MTDCPKCASEQLVETPALGNIPLDVCPGCKGIWFDKGELEDLLRQSGGAGANLELISPKPEGLVCPRCKAKMSRGGLVNPLLIVDKCQSCGGVWLDARELELVKKQLGLTGGPSPEVSVARPARAPEAKKPGGGLSFMKLVAGLTAAAGLAGCSYEIYLYLSPAVAVGRAPSLALAVVSALMLIGGIFYINWHD